jgi:hypothetical protein
MADLTRPGARVSDRRPASASEATRRHVIAESRHRLQQVTCECGWLGSSAMPDGRTSEWSRHVAENRGRTF